MEKRLKEQQSCMEKRLKELERRQSCMEERLEDLQKQRCPMEKQLLEQQCRMGERLMDMDTATGFKRIFFWVEADEHVSEVLLAGAQEKLGEWNPYDAPCMKLYQAQCNPKRNLWCYTIDVPVGNQFKFEYKYIGKVEEWYFWEPFGNRRKATDLHSSQSEVCERPDFLGGCVCDVMRSRTTTERPLNHLRELQRNLERIQTDLQRNLEDIRADLRDRKDDIDVLFGDVGNLKKKMEGPSMQGLKASVEQLEVASDELRVQIQEIAQTTTAPPSTQAAAIEAVGQVAGTETEAAAEAHRPTVSASPAGQTPIASIAAPPEAVPEHDEKPALGTVEESQQPNAAAAAVALGAESQQATAEPVATEAAAAAAAAPAAATTTAAAPATAATAAATPATPAGSAPSNGPPSRPPSLATTPGASAPAMEVNRSAGSNARYSTPTPKFGPRALFPDSKAGKWGRST